MDPIGGWSTCNAPEGRGAVGPRGVSRRSGDVRCHGYEPRRGNCVWLWSKLDARRISGGPHVMHTKAEGRCSREGEAHVGGRGAMGWSGVVGIASGSG